MSRSRTPFPSGWSLGDLLKHLGDIPPERVRLDPSPGRATERHVTYFDDHEDRLYELIDGVLVEKAPGFAEAYVATQIGAHIGNYTHEYDIGIVTGGSGPFRFGPRQVRIPDAAFTSWERLPGKVVPNVAIPDLAPDLAVEVLSEGNTEKEMQRKLKDYFAAGVRLVWYVDVKKRAAEIFHSPDRRAIVTVGQALVGGEVLPGFRLPLGELFVHLAPPGDRKKSS